MFRKNIAIEFGHEVGPIQEPSTIIEGIGVTRVPNNIVLHAVIAAIDIIALHIPTEHIIIKRHSKTVEIFQRMRNHVFTNLIYQHLALKLFHFLP